MVFNSVFYKTKPYDNKQDEEKKKRKKSEHLLLYVP